MEIYFLFCIILNFIKKDSTTNIMSAKTIFERVGGKEGMDKTIDHFYDMVL